VSISHQIIIPNNFCTCDLPRHSFDLTFASQGNISKINLRIQLVTNVTKKSYRDLRHTKSMPEGLYMLGLNWLIQNTDPFLMLNLFVTNMQVTTTISVSYPPKLTSHRVYFLHHKHVFLTITRYIVYIR